MEPLYLPRDAYLPPVEWRGERGGGGGGEAEEREAREAGRLVSENFPPVLL